MLQARPTGRAPLPTMLRGSAGGPPAAKKRRASHKQTKIYNKDIICLPHVPGDDVLIPIPRGEKRSKLAVMGLIGKIAIHWVWKSSQVQAEVSSIFASAFGLSQEDILSYEYLRYINYLIKLIFLSLFGPCKTSFRY